MSTKPRTSRPAPWSSSVRTIGPGLLLGLACLSAAGCGGGGNSSPATAPVTLTVDWPARTRGATAPASALSATVSVPAALPGGKDFSWTIDREPGTAAYTRQYVSEEQVASGTYSVTVRFFAQAGGKGDMVGSAAETVAIAPGHTLGTLIVSGTVASVEAAPDQFVPVGRTADLAFIARDGKGNVVAVTPGSASFSQAGGKDSLSVAADGRATGIAFGTAQVTVSVDGVRSAPVSVLSAPSYTLTDLGTLPGKDSSEGVAINNRGQAAGNSWSGARGSGTMAVLWDSGRATPLGALPGDTDSAALALGGSGAVVGFSYSSAPGAPSHAFLWRAGSMADAASVVPGAFDLAGVNTAGSLVGTMGGTGDGFLWANGVLSLPPDGNAPGVAFTTYYFEAVSDTDIAAGVKDEFVSDTDIRQTPFLFQSGAVTLLPNGGASRVQVLSVNARGQVAGGYTVGQANQAPAFWSGGALVPIRPLAGYTGGWANSVNRNGEVVGTLTGGFPRNNTAFLWKDGVSVEVQRLLPAGSPFVYDVRGINDSGQMVGNATVDGRPRAVLLTPKP